MQGHQNHQTRSIEPKVSTPSEDQHIKLSTLVWSLWRRIHMQQDNEPKHIKALQEQLKGQRRPWSHDCPLTATQFSIYRGSWKLRKPLCDITRHLVEHCQILLGWHDSADVPLTCGVHAAQCMLSLKQKRDIPIPYQFFKDLTFLSHC